MLAPGLCLAPRPTPAHLQGRGSASRPGLKCTGGGSLKPRSPQEAFSSTFKNKINKSLHCPAAQNRAPGREAFSPK